MSRRWSRTICVGNLPGDIREREVGDLFYKYGRIVDIDLKVPPRPPGYAFVEFEDPRDAEDACVGRDGYNFDGHRLRVEPAHDGRGSGGPSPEAPQMPPSFKDVVLTNLGDIQTWHNLLNKDLECLNKKVDSISSEQTMMKKEMKKNVSTAQASFSVFISEFLDGQKEIISKLDQLLAGQKAHGKDKIMEINVENQNAFTEGVNKSISKDMKKMRRSLSMIDLNAEDRFKRSSGLSSSSPISSIPFKASDDKGGEKDKSQTSQRGEKSKEKASAEEETSPSGRSRSSRSAKRA